VPNLPNPDLTLQEAFDRALKARPDYQAALERVQAAEASPQGRARRIAAVGSSPPTPGDLGLTPADSHGTYAVTGAVTYRFSRAAASARGRLLAADAALRSGRAEAEDMKSAVYYEVRSAFLDLKATEEQLQVATQAREPAAQQLSRARHVLLVRGPEDRIEPLVRALRSDFREQYIGARYRSSIAKAVLARGRGVAEEAARQYIGGIR
jgi:outer membrane protein TolC